LGAGAGAALRQLARYVLPYRGAAALLVVTMLVEVAYETALPLSLKFLIDEAIGPGNVGLMLAVLLALAGGFLLSTAAMVGRDYLYAWLMSHVLADIRVRMFEHLQRLPLSFFARTRAGDLMSRFSTDLAAVENALVLGVPGALLSIFYVTASIGALVWIEWRLAGGLLLALPVCLIGPRIFGGRAVNAGYALRTEQAGLANLVQENIGAQPVVKAFDLGDSALRGFRSQALRLLTFNVRFSFLSYLTERSPNVGMAAFNLMALGLGAWFVVRGVISVGSLVSFYALFVSVSASVLNLTSLATTLLQATSGMQRIEEVLGATPSLVDRQDARALPRLAREIAFKNVSFSYAGETQNLADVSLRIPAGERVAFVGPSGCGKSTALTMILRFYDPGQGRITFDGIDLRDAARPSLYRQIGVVFQDNFMFAGTIRDNILLGRPSATQADVEAAARAAEMHDFIVKQPKGYDSLVGERGGGLSGGQRQRVAIARPLFAIRRCSSWMRRPRLLIRQQRLR
jgi:ATP-binding cassette subfamily B protein